MYIAADTCNPSADWIGNDRLQLHQKMHQDACRTSFQQQFPMKALAVFLPRVSS
jgi:hypothetical protein